MPVIVKAAVWNAMTEIGAMPVAQDPTARVSFTNLLKWQDRLKLLRSVVTLADRALAIPTGLPKGTSVLRMFLAPEYYFAESCDRHVMDYETRGHVVQGLGNISADLREMLLIPGTVSYFKPLVDKKVEKRRLKLDAQHKPRTVRYAGYFKADEENSTYLAHNTAYAFYNGQQVFKYRKRLDASELNKQDVQTVKGVMVFVTGDAVGVFDFDKAGTKLRIGVEICADHGDSQLKQCGASGLDLQIVLSASVPVNPNAAVVRNGGCLFRCNARPDSTDGTGSAWQLVDGNLVDLRTLQKDALASERIDPLTRREFKDVKSKTEKLDKLYAKTHTGFVSNSQLEKRITMYLEARGGTVHFYEATLP